jgi:uncharacterized DUF497 family protein
MRFAWDPLKERSNRAKHGVSFEEARSIFLDSNALLIGDPEHSASEERYVLLGISLLGRLITVHHVYRQNNEIIRIISARKATKREMIQYTKVNL